MSGTIKNFRQHLARSGGGTGYTDQQMVKALDIARKSMKAAGIPDARASAVADHQAGLAVSCFYHGQPIVTFPAQGGGTQTYIGHLTDEPPAVQIGVMLGGLAAQFVLGGGAVRDDLADADAGHLHALLAGDIEDWTEARIRQEFERTESVFVDRKPALREVANLFANDRHVDGPEIERLLRQRSFPRADSRPVERREVLAKLGGKALAERRTKAVAAIATKATSVRRQIEYFCKSAIDELRTK